MQRDFQKQAGCRRSLWTCKSVLVCSGMTAALSVEFRVSSEDGNRFYSTLATQNSKPQALRSRIFTARISRAQLVGCWSRKCARSSLLIRARTHQECAEPRAQGKIPPPSAPWPRAPSCVQFLSGPRPVPGSILFTRADDYFVSKKIAGLISGTPLTGPGTSRPSKSPGR
jgi:hypothetical protein